MNDYIVTIHFGGYRSKLTLEIESDNETEAEVEEDVKSLFPNASLIDARIKTKRTF